MKDRRFEQGNGKRFVKVYKEVCDVSKSIFDLCEEGTLNPADFYVYLCLRLHSYDINGMGARMKEYILKDIEELTGYNERQLQRIINKLFAVGLLHEDKQGKFITMMPIEKYNSKDDKVDMRKMKGKFVMIYENVIEMVRDSTLTPTHLYIFAQVIKNTFVSYDENSKRSTSSYFKAITPAVGLTTWSDIVKRDRALVSRVFADLQDVGLLLKVIKEDSKRNTPAKYFRFLYPIREDQRDWYIKDFNKTVQHSGSEITTKDLTSEYDMEKEVVRNEEKTELTSEDKKNNQKRINDLINSLGNDPVEDMS